MKITNISIKKLNDEDSLKGYATIFIDNCLAIHNIKIIDGKKGLFIAFPSQKGSNGKWYDIVHPITQDFRDLISEEILTEYRK